MSSQTIRLLTLLPAVALAAGNARATAVIDEFSGGPVGLEVFSDGAPPLLSVGGNYDDPGALGGRRSISLTSTFQTVALEVDPSPAELRFDTDNGVGRFFLAYGSLSNNGMGVQDDHQRRLNADWSAVEAIRFHVTRNTGRMSVTTYLGTARGDAEPGGAYSGQSAAPAALASDGFTGALDIPLSEFSAIIGPGVDLSDVDYIWFLVENRQQGTDFTIDRIELVTSADPADLNGDGCVDSGDLAILLAAWGEQGADLDGDNVTGSGDLAALLAAWGPCE